MVGQFECKSLLGDSWIPASAGMTIVHMCFGLIKTVMPAKAGIQLSSWDPESSKLTNYPVVIAL